MILAEKLYQLRTRSGLSQEELAEKMNVSRQSISKWESANSIPSMDKIVELSKIYGVSTDFLLKDEMEEIPGEIIADLNPENAVREVTIEEIRDYQKNVEQNRNTVALGVMLCVWSAIPLMISEGLSIAKVSGLTEDTASIIGVVLVLVIIAAAVGIFIKTGSGLHKYDFLNEEGFSLAYGAEAILKKEMEELQPAYQKKRAEGTVLCILSVIPILISSIFEANEEYSFYGVAILLLLVGIGVFQFVSSSMQMDVYKKLLQIDDYKPENKRVNKKLSVFSTVYWLLATAVYLLWSFLTMNWGTTWVIWPVAGLLFAAIYAILNATAKKER
ncbi:MAG: helix-turn-helix domain-containing protein [Anaerovoracaceae bacterium]